MPNLIPPTDDNDASSSKEDCMSNALRSQFGALKRLHAEKRREMNGPRNNDLSKSTLEDTDDETLSSDQVDPLPSSPSFTHQNSTDDSVFLQLAISTAISAQNEIDALMNGIDELEAIVQSKKAANVLTRAGHHSSVDGTSNNRHNTLVDNFDE